MTLPENPRPWWASLRALLAALTLAGAVTMGATACELGGGDGDDAEQGEEDGGYGGGRDGDEGDDEDGGQDGGEEDDD
ncbi:hypothetical protein SUDANB121_01232 [Nocardiopsis dassonvillei]|uniref:hypothetical protein n=1 Tax=Nocardiopsis dassonvillei TaxID=2014 RepID=UPI003F5537C9